MNTTTLCTVCSLLSVVWIALRPAAAQVQISQAVRHDVSVPLSELAQCAQAPAAQAAPTRPRATPRNRLPMLTAELRADTVLQTRAHIKQRASLMMRFQGIGNDRNSNAPPDTTGAAGTTQFVEMVNDMGLAVFDKASGEKVCGPVLANTVFAGFGGACETNYGVDPNVMGLEQSRAKVIRRLAPISFGNRDTTALV